jgi:hypothetical protein
MASRSCSHGDSNLRNGAGNPPRQPDSPSCRRRRRRILNRPDESIMAANSVSASKAPSSPQPATYRTDSLLRSSPTLAAARCVAVSTVTSARSRPYLAYPTPTACTVSINVRNLAFAGCAESTTIRRAF